MATRVEKVTVKLRSMIVDGALPPGSRVPERDLATVLGVSRTPVRVALGVLEAEGLVSGEPNCGFVVNSITVEDVLSAYDVRGVIEGLAARTAVERGLSAQTLRVLEECVAEGAALVALGVMGDEEMRRWSDANERFHDTILYAADLAALTKVHGFLSRMPLAAPVAIFFTDDRRDLSLRNMIEAHEQHIQVLDALRNGEGARAEYLMREHAVRSRNNLAPILRARAGQMASDPGSKRTALRAV